MEQRKLDKQYGCCKFCGQTRLFQVNELLYQEELDKMATEQCKCIGASDARRITEQTGNAESTIEALFGDTSIAEVMKAAVVPVSNEDIKSVTVCLENGIKGIVKYSKGKVRIEKKVNMTNTVDC